jgi:hypothetical protein
MFSLKYYLNFPPKFQEYKGYHTAYKVERLYVSKASLLTAKVGRWLPVQRAEGGGFKGGHILIP